jgi:hypothetical protein
VQIEADGVMADLGLGQMHRLTHQRLASQRSIAARPGARSRGCGG